MTTSKRTTTDVLIVGAGPTGLTLANILAQYDIPFRVIDQKAGPGDQSRASVVHIRTLELWDKLGVAEPAIADGVRVRGVKLSVNGKPATSFPLAAKEGVPTPFPFVLSYPQGKTEQLLVNKLHHHASAMMWQTQLMGLIPNSHGVRVLIRCADGELEEVDAKYVVGADGARSSVRHLLNVPFPGSTYPSTSFLADVTLDPPLDNEHIHLNLANGGFVGIIALGQGCYRLFGSLSPDYAARFHVQDEGRKVALPDLQQWFEEYFYLSNRITRVDWTTIYRIHQRIASTFRVGRVFLVGDAAHIHSPAGGQGMNLGVGDAVNLGWKLGLVLRNEASDELLNSYDAERRPVAHAVLRGADRGFELEATQNPIVELFRLYVLPRIVTVTGYFGLMRGMIFRLFSQTWINYRNSPLHEMLRDRSGLAKQIGSRAPYGVFQTGPHRGQPLFTLLRGPDHHLLVFEGQQGGGVSTEVEVQIQALLDRYRVRIHTHRIDQGNRELHARYQVSRPSIVLIRPDGHIAYAGSAADLTSLSNFLDRWFLPRQILTRQSAASTTLVAQT